MSSGAEDPTIVEQKRREFDAVRTDHLKRRQLYEDPTFLPVDSSLFFSTPPAFPVQWLRPNEITWYGPKPVFSDGINRFDVCQGELADCWFVAAMACLCSRPEYRPLFERVVDPNQSFQDDWYAGVFRFNFWRFGQWEQVLIDDLLPTRGGHLVYSYSPHRNEFWPALMEKAYAKVNGSFEGLSLGFLLDSLTDLTGGLAEFYRLHGPDADFPKNIHKIIHRALERQSIIGCNILNSGRGVEALRPNGLLEAHAYTIGDIREIEYGQNRENKVILIKVRNPLGDSMEWNGRWNERSDEWQQISPELRKDLVISKPDGEFWMEFGDFQEQFDDVIICNLTPDSPVDFKKKWFSVDHHGRWTKYFNAGGSSSSPKHWSNPQYLLKLEDTDEDDDNMCSVVIQLMQKDRRKIKRQDIRARFLNIGFYVYKIPEGLSPPLKKEFFQHNKSVASAGDHSRQVTKRLTLSPGKYVVVPCTFNAEEEGDFYLRFFFEKGQVSEYLDQKTGAPNILEPTPSPEWKEKEQTFRDFFYKVSGEDLEVNAFELREAINEELKKENINISTDACKSFITLMAADGYNKLSFNAFQTLWDYLSTWKAHFFQFDVDRSGSLDSRELGKVTDAAGYRLSNETLGRLVFRYADENGKISLNNCFAAMAHLMNTHNVFRDTQNYGRSILGLEQWLERTLFL
ncbi:calpain-A [Aplysia californica]|uniref:Calpain-A n=1 Tax=Aplysia californica TaxID=6500 RepID=A0ABM0K0B6_APLCA|nr:calpain-A [Aplysia californica]